MAGGKVKLRYNPEHPISYGYYHCETCDSEFYGGGRALHADGCPEEGYKGCVYVFGMYQIPLTDEMLNLIIEHRPS